MCFGGEGGVGCAKRLDGFVAPAWFLGVGGLVVCVVFVHVWLGCFPPCFAFSGVFLFACEPFHVFLPYVVAFCACARGWNRRVLGHLRR